MNDKVVKLKKIYSFEKVNKDNISKYILECIIEEDKEILKIKLNFLNFIIDIDEIEYEILSEKDFWFEKNCFEDKSDYDIIIRFYDLIITIIENKTKGDEKNKLLLSFFEKDEKYKEIFYLIYTFINNQRNEKKNLLNDDESLFLFIYFIGGKTQKFLKNKFINKIIFYLDQLDTDYSNLNFQILNIKLLNELNKCALSTSVINYKLAFENEKIKLSKNIKNDKKKENKLTTNINSEEIKEENNVLYLNIDNKLFENKKNNFELNTNGNDISKQQNDIDNQDLNDKSNEKYIKEDKKNNVKLKEITINIENKENNENLYDKTDNEKNDKNVIDNIKIDFSKQYIKDKKENDSKENKNSEIIINDPFLILSKLNEYNQFQIDEGINLKKVKIKNLIVKYLQIENYLSSLINRIIFTNNIQETLFSLSNNIFKLENENGLLKIDLMKLKILIEKLKVPNLINLKRKIIDIICIEISKEYYNQINIKEYNPDKKFLNKIKTIIEKKIENSKIINKNNNSNNNLNKKLEFINECLKKGYKEGNLYFLSIKGINGKKIKYLIDCLYFFKNQLNPIVHIGKGNGQFYLLPKSFYDNKEVTNNYTKLFLEILDENNDEILKNNINHNIISEIPEIKKISKNELINFFFENNIRLKILEDNYIEELKQKLLSPLNIFFFQINFYHSNLLNCFSNSKLKEKIILKIENYQKLIKSLFENIYILFRNFKITKEILQKYKNYLSNEFEIISHIIEEDDLKQQFIKKIYHCLQLEVISKQFNMLIEKLNSEEEERKNINKNLIHEYLNNLEKIKEMILISDKYFNSFKTIFNKWKDEKDIQEKDLDFTMFKYYLFILLPEKTYDIEFEFNFNFKESVWLLKNGLFDLIN